MRGAPNTSKNISRSKGNGTRRRARCIAAIGKFNRLRRALHQGIGGLCIEGELPDAACADIGGIGRADLRSIEHQIIVRGIQPNPAAVDSCHAQLILRSGIGGDLHF